MITALEPFISSIVTFEETPDELKGNEDVEEDEAQLPTPTNLCKG